MDMKTGAIAQFETEEDAEKAGYTEKLTKEQFRKFRGMNRHDRLAEQKKLQLLATAERLKREAQK